MMKATHINFALMVTLPFINISNYPYIFLSVGAATLPDLDLKLKIKHRTWTHSLLVYSIAAALIYYFDPIGALFFSIGYLSHLFMDSLTISGVKWLYPFYKKSYGMCKVRVGSRFEKLINSFIVVILLLYVIYKLFFVLNFSHI